MSHRRQAAKTRLIPDKAHRDWIDKHGYPEERDTLTEQDSARKRLDTHVQKALEKARSTR